jgi:predicted nucleic acid-binding protein
VSFCLDVWQHRDRFASSKKVHILLPDNATTSYFVDIAVFACKKGIQLSSHDIWIAALAEQWNATLVTFDNDFGHLAHKDLRLRSSLLDLGKQITQSCLHLPELS